MTTPEEQLRRLLHDEAEHLVPSADGLRVIQERLLARRSWRRFSPLLAVAASLALVVGGTAATSVLDRVETRTDARERADPVGPVEPVEAQDGCGGGSTSAVLCAESPAPPPVPVTSGVTTSASGTPFWPFSDDREAASWLRSPGPRTWAGDPRAVAQHLVDDYLRLRGLVAGPTEGTSVPLLSGAVEVGVADLVQVGRDRDTARPWSVTRVRSPRVDVTAPSEGARVGSPLEARGTAAGAPRLRLLSASGRALAATTGAASGGSGPFRASLDWDDLTWTTAVVVATTGDPVDGLAVRPVRRAGAASPGIPPAASTFVALDAGAVVLHDSRTGQRLRQLSYPPTGQRDSSPARTADGVVFVRSRTDRCESEVVRISLGYGASGVTVPWAERRRDHPSQSPDGRLLTWVEQPCAGGGGDLVRRGPDGVERRLPLVAGRTDLSALRHLSTRDDGTLVLERSAGGVLTLAGDATSVEQAVPVRSGQCVDTAPSWSGQDLFLWRGCPGRLVGLLLAGPRYGHGLQAPSDPVGGVLATSVTQAASGPAVLVQLGSRNAVGPVLRLVDGRFVTLYANEGCVGSTGPCLTDPSW